MAYANFGFYTTQYRGNVISKEDFPRLAERANEYIDSVTRQRAARYFSENSLPIKKAVCAVAEIVQQSERGNSLAREEREIQTEIVDRHHITYTSLVNTASREGQSAIGQAMYAAAARYLAQTGLLYRGVG